MKKLPISVVLAAATAVLAWLPSQGLAQEAGGGGGGRGRNFDPEQMRERMMTMYKDRLEIKSDDEWKAIQPRVQKVVDARREVGMGGGGMRGMFGPRRGGPGGDNQGDQGGDRRPNFGGRQSAAAQDLEKALDSKASAEQIKAKLAAYREDRKQKQENLAKAQEDLKKVLTVRQEAAAVLAGLLD